MQCRDFREIADSYLSDELLVETNHDVLKHLEGCADCRRELTARREMRAQLRKSVRRLPDFQMRPEFAFRLRNDLKALAARPTRKSLFTFPHLSRSAQWVGVAGCLMIAAIIGFVVLDLRETPSRGELQLARAESDGGDPSRRSRASQPDEAAMRSVGFAMMGKVVGDHRNCALDFQLDEEPISLEEAGRRFDPAYTDLAQAVMAGRGALPADIKLLAGHSCIYDNQRFAHVALEHRGRTISVLVANKNGTGDSLPVAEHADGAVVACSRIDGFQVSCFETRRHSVYIVSELTEAENLAVARALAPSVSAHIARAEKIA